MRIQFSLPLLLLVSSLLLSLCGAASLPSLNEFTRKVNEIGQQGGRESQIIFLGDHLNKLHGSGKDVTKAGQLIVDLASAIEEKDETKYEVTLGKAVQNLVLLGARIN